MVLRLDPRYPLVWRSPSSLQLGVSTPRVVLDDVSTATEQLLAALITGVSRSGLSMIARQAGVDETAVTALLDRIEPALGAAAVAPTATVVVAGSGETAERVTDGLASSGLRVQTASSAASGTLDECDLAIVVAHYVVEPALHGLWLRRDIPHLPVVLSDTAVTIGPFIEPGTGPCLYCLQLHHTDADPAWPAIASQLWGRRSALDAAPLSGEVAGLVARLTIARLESELSTPLSHTIEDGTASTRLWTVHPECGCLSLSK